MSHIFQSFKDALVGCNTRHVEAHADNEAQQTPFVDASESVTHGSRECRLERPDRRVFVLSLLALLACSLGFAVVGRVLEVIARFGG